MPYIDSKLSVKATEAQKEELKARLGQALAILGKPESYLMVGIQDGYDLFFGGRKLDRGAYVEVSLLGNASSESYTKMSAALCDIYKDIFEIPGEAVYITYHGISDWGWNGTNF